jgi:hypothetical protein
MNHLGHVVVVAEASDCHVRNYREVLLTPNHEDLDNTDSLKETIVLLSLNC